MKHLDVTNIPYGISDFNKPMQLMKFISEVPWFGLGAKILSGVTIGQGAGDRG